MDPSPQTPQYNKKDGQSEPRKSRNPFRKNKPQEVSSTSTITLSTAPNDLSIKTKSTESSASFASSTNTSLESPLQTPLSTKSSSSFAQRTYEDTRHFVGGIVTRPSESTKHFSIVRHSHGLVFYQGSNTSLAITVFSDEPLPTDRTFWLQNKGWTGKTGMRAKALIGINGKWINITPTMTVNPSQLDPSDERAWQRDITKFLKKAPSKIQSHAVRETVIIRIPGEAGDGYFQIVMCLGDNKKKVLCPSPVFRVLSTSARPGSVKGAGIVSLPLEFGAMALATYAHHTVGRVFMPVTAVVNMEVKSYLPTWWARKAASSAVGAAEVGDKVIMAQNSKLLDAQYQALSAEQAEAALEEGPQAPYPIRFTGRSQCNSSNMGEKLELPNFTLTDVADTVMHQLHGYYLGWAREVAKAKDEKPWCQAIISVTAIDTSQLARVSVGQKIKSISLRLLDVPDSPVIDKEKLEIIVLAFIRPDEPLQKAKLEEGIQAGDEAAEEAAVITETNDVSVAEEILNHPAWSVEAASRPRTGERKTSGMQKIAQGYVNARTAAQRQVDKVQLSKVGIRLDTDKAREKDILMNGFYVVR